MKTFKLFLKDILSDGDKISSKRFIALSGFLFLAITMLVNSFFDINKAPADSLVYAVEFITMVAIGGATAEKFLKGKTEEDIPQSNCLEVKE
jgi:hypothetical protein